MGRHNPHITTAYGKERLSVLFCHRLSCSCLAHTRLAMKHQNETAPFSRNDVLCANLTMVLDSLSLKMAADQSIDDDFVARIELQSVKGIILKRNVAQMSNIQHHKLSFP